MIEKKLIDQNSSNILRSSHIVLKKGEEVGWHTTKNREELIVILKGEATLFQNYDGNIERTNLRETETYHIKKEILHNIENASDADLEYIYVVGLIK